MTRLIDADAIPWDVEGVGEIPVITKDEIDQLPTVNIPTTVGESVGVIRCKDCRFSGADATCCLVCKREGMGLKPFHVYHDDFCSYAERKEE